MRYNWMIHYSITRDPSRDVSSEVLNRTIEALNILDLVAEIEMKTFNAFCLDNESRALSIIDGHWVHESEFPTEGLVMDLLHIIKKHAKLEKCNIQYGYERHIDKHFTNAGEIANIHSLINLIL